MFDIEPEKPCTIGGGALEGGPFAGGAGMDVIEIGLEGGGGGTAREGNEGG